MKSKALIASAVLAVVVLCAAAAEYRPEAWNLQAREKFAEQRYGVFIVWGLYAYYAQGECYMWHGKIDRDAYERIVDGFYPSKFNAREWVRIVRRSGAKYITVTARHCDGFALWPAKAVEIFEGIGKWFEKNGDSIYGTKAGGVSLGDKVVTTRKGDTLYIHFLDPSVKEFTFKLGDEIKTVKCPRSAGDAFDVVVRFPLGGKEPTQYVPTATLALADPFVLLDNGTYYAYGTYAGDGIAVAVSKDLKNWKLSKGRAAGGLALHKSDSYGNHSFWAPEVYKRDGKFVMLYSAEGHVCAAVADSPLGPFRQAEKKPLLERAGIDNSLFVDDDGRSWMVYVHFDRGNTIWLAELEKDWLHVKPGTARMLFRADTPWEGNAITEGPFVVKIGKKYVLTYSGRAFWDPDYAVGYALADKPEGPWRKSASNPILRRFRGLRGTGHHSLFKDKDGKWRIVFHTHASPTTVGMRRTYIADFIVGGTPDAPELSVGGELIPCMLEP